MTARIIASGLLLLATLTFSALSALGQEIKYKVGDRVEIDSMESSDPRNARYKKGTIVEIDEARPYDKAYIVTFDDSPNSKHRYIIRDYTKHWIRDIQGGNADAKPDAKPDAPAPPINAKPEDANQPPPANAAPGDGFKYKVGDRVEVDTAMANQPNYASWKKGTVTAVDTRMGVQAYIIQVDPEPGKLPKESHIPLRDYADKWLRPIGGTAPTIESDKLRVDENNTVLADRELLDCKNMKRGPAHNGQAPPTELVKQLIRCTFERPSDRGQDGVRTMDIVGFAATGTRPWTREYQGMHATAATIIHLFHVKYDKKTFYRTTTETETGSERNFACYVDGTEWYCDTAAGDVKDGPKKSIQVKKN